jgi:hypothetical protein
MMNSNVDFLEKSSSYHDSHSDLGGQILDVVRRVPEYDMEKLLHAFPDYTWNQVFLEVDRLSRTGEIQLLLKGKGLYSVRLPLPIVQQNSTDRLLVSA